ncbi:hypothetical protein D3C76_818820 [compost metagenome]
MSLRDTPAAAKICPIARARCSESCWLNCAEPAESVWPTTNTFLRSLAGLLASCSRLLANSFATRVIFREPSVVRVAEPTGNISAYSRDASRPTAVYSFCFFWSACAAANCSSRTCIFRPSSLAIFSSRSTRFLYQRPPPQPTAAPAIVPMSTLSLPPWVAPIAAPATAPSKPPPIQLTQLSLSATCLSMVAHPVTNMVIAIATAVGFALCILIINYPFNCYGYLNS